MESVRLSTLLLRWQEALEEGADLSPEQLCEGRPELIEKVRPSLEALRAMNRLMADSSEGPMDTTASNPLPPVPAEAPGYAIVSELGRGGMGVVYKAIQKSAGRVVALKMIRGGGYAGDGELARFRGEAEALGRLQHPNIVQVFEVGQAAGQPFFSLELCPGGSLDRHLGGEPMPAAASAALVQALAQGVAAAHAANVVHRDLKPANVLLAGDGTPKITDFGLAKRTDAQAGQTHTGEVLGTPAYMAPEQARGDRDVGASADVYALGVILYECLIGRPPFKGATALETLDQVLNNDPVPPRALQPSVPKDLETICLKCLRKEPAQRYLSAGDLADDLGRFLGGEPVRARPVGPLERAWKWLRRRPAAAGLVAACAFAVLALVGGAVGTTLGMLRAERARADEAEQRQIAEQNEQAALAAQAVAEKRLGQLDKANEVLASIFRGLDPSAEEKGGPPLLAQLADSVEKAAGQLDAEAVGDPLAVARLQSLLGASLRELGRPKQAIELLTRARRTREARLGAEHHNTLATLSALAGAYQSDGQFPRAIELREQVVKRQTQRSGPAHRRTLVAINNLGNAYRDGGRFKDAVAVLEPAVPLMKAHLGDDDADTLTGMSSLAAAYQATGHYAKAAPLIEEVLAKQQSRGPDDPARLSAMANLASVYENTGRRPEAIALYEEARDRQRARLGPTHPETLRLNNNLAEAFRANGELARAMPLFEEVLTGTRARLGPNHPRTLTAINNLAAGHFQMGQPDKAIPLFQQAIALQEAKLGKDHYETLRSVNNLAVVYRFLRQPGKAIPLLEDVVARQKASRSLGPDHPHTLMSSVNLALAYRDAARGDEAADLLETVLARRRVKLGLPHADTLNTMELLAQVHLEQGQVEKGLALFDELATCQRKRYSKDAPRLASALGRLGHLLLSQRQPAAAEKYLRECLALREKATPDSWQTAEVRSDLGAALLARKRYSAAEPLLLRGHEGLRAQSDKIPIRSRAARLKDAAERLVRLYEEQGKPAEAAKYRKLLPPGSPDKKN